MKLLQTQHLNTQFFDEFVDLQKPIETLRETLNETGKNMDIKTLFKKFEERRIVIDNHPGRWISWWDVEKIFDELKVEVVKVPQEIADWIEFFKERGLTLQGSTNPGAHYELSILEELVDKFPTICFSDILS